MFVKQKRIIDFFIDLIYWFGIFLAKESFMNVPQIQSTKMQCLQLGGERSPAGSCEWQGFNEEE